MVAFLPWPKLLAEERRWLNVEIPVWNVNLCVMLPAATAAVDNVTALTHLAEGSAVRFLMRYLVKGVFWLRRRASFFLPRSILQQETRPRSQKEARCSHILLGHATVSHEDSAQHHRFKPQRSFVLPTVGLSSGLGLVQQLYRIGGKAINPYNLPEKKKKKNDFKIYLICEDRSKLVALAYLLKAPGRFSPGR